MSKWIAILLGMLLLITNGAWLYSAIDLAATEKYRQLEEHNNKEQIKSLTMFGNHFLSGKSKEEIRAIVMELFPDSEPFEKEGHLFAQWLTFKLDSEGNIEGMATYP